MNHFLTTNPETGEMLSTEEQAKAHAMSHIALWLGRCANGEWSDEKQSEFLCRVFRAMPRGEEMKARLGIDRGQFGAWTDVDEALHEWLEEWEVSIREPADAWHKYLKTKGQARRNKVHPDSGFFK